METRLSIIDTWFSAAFFVLVQRSITWDEVTEPPDPKGCAKYGVVIPILGWEIAELHTVGCLLLGFVGIPKRSFPDGLAGKESVSNAGDPGLIPRTEKSAGKGNGNSLQYSCVENPMDRGAWQATVHGVTNNRTWLSRAKQVSRKQHQLNINDSIHSSLVLKGQRIWNQADPSLNTDFDSKWQCGLESETHSVMSTLSPGYQSHSFLQGFSQPRDQTQVSHCRRILYQLSHQGSPRILEWAAYPFSSGSSHPRNWAGFSYVAGGFFTIWATREAQEYWSG